MPFLYIFPCSHWPQQCLGILYFSLRGRGEYTASSGDHDAFAEALDKEWPGPVPYTLVVAPGGKVVYRKVGAIDPLEVKRAIVSHLGRTY